MGKKTGKRTAKIRDLGVKDAKSVKGGLISGRKLIVDGKLKEPS